MNARIEFQTILGADGLPAFVVLPYAEFMRRFDPDRDLVPNAVVNLAMDQGWSPARAWREHLGLTQAVVAQRLGVSQSAVAQFEAAEAKLKPATRGKLAAALGVSPEQLRW